VDCVVATLGLLEVRAIGIPLSHGADAESASNRVPVVFGASVTLAWLNVIVALICTV
jgi:hypothetical protein